jgi:ABC-type transport system involved in multi-copper enzyme maturation permease subunit
MGAMLACVFILLIPLLLVGIITGALLNLGIGVSYDFSFLTGHWLLYALLYILATALSLFTYSLLAIGLATLGKATAAGVTGALIWWFLEGIIGNLLNIVGSFNKGALGSFLQAIPNYYIGNNLSALRDNLYSEMTNATGQTSISTLHALLVIIAYLIIFAGVAWWVQKSRDITN